MSRILGALLALSLLVPAARAAVSTVTITGSIDKPAGSSDSALDPCRRCRIEIEYVGTNDLTAESLVVTDTPVIIEADDDGDWTTAPLKLYQTGNYRFRFFDPAWPQAGFFLDVTKTAATCATPCSATFDSLTTVNVAEGADVSALDHGSLSGLADDDHTLYSKKAAETGYTGTHDFSGATVNGIGYGDLSGVPATFAPSSHSIASHSDTTATGAELETLTDGSDADSLHTHGGLDDWTDSGTVVSIQSGRDLAVGASVTVDNSTGTVDATAYEVGGVALASTHLSDGATVTNLGDTIEASEISDTHAGTVLTADLEEETHASEHSEGGADPIVMSSFEVSDLGDVSATAPTSGQALAWDGSEWAPTTITGSVSALNDLSDATVSGAASGEILVHDGSAFANVAVSGDATLSSAGALSLAANSVDTAELAAGAVTNTEIAAAAGISLSKIEDSATAGLFLQSGGSGGDPAYGAIVAGDLPSGATLDTEWDTIAEIETATGANIFTASEGALADDDLSDDSINALSDVDTATTAPTSGQVLSWDGVSKWTPGNDDDVPESGDFGAAADLESDGSLSADVVGAAELADGDYGDVSFSAGVITLDAGVVDATALATDSVEAAEIAAGAVGSSELAADSVDASHMADADHGDVTWASGVATLDADTVGASELAATAVTAGSYTFTALTVDADGRITAASSGTDDDSPDDDSEVPDAITVGVGGTVAAAASVSVEAAEISDAHAGTDITADLEEETHASEHENGGADEISVAGLSGELADAQPVAAHKDGAAATGTRSGLNFEDTSPITVTLTDDAVNDWVDITIACPSCVTSSSSVAVEEGDASVTATLSTLDFGPGFDVTDLPTGEANVVLDYTEDPVDLSTSEVTGTLPAASVGNGLTDAQVGDTLTIGSASTIAEGALPSNVVLENETWTKSSGVTTYASGTIAVAADEWTDADISNNLTSDNHLPLAGGTMTGNIVFSGAQTVDGTDISAHVADASAHHTKTTSASELTSGTLPAARLPSEAARLDEAETVTGAWTFEAAPTLDVTGAPFTMGASVTGTVTRLDADLLDGEHASAFADASHAHAGEDITSGTVADARVASTITRDTEWDTAAEINAATTDDDFVTETGTHTLSGALTLSGSVDAGSGTVEIPNSTTLPATCAIGDVYMDTDATSGQRLYLCESANTWALQGDGGGSSVTLDVAYDNEGATGNRSVTLDDGNVKFDMTDAANDYHLVVDNTSTGTMDRGVQVYVSGVGGVITNAIDASDAEIVNAIKIGANNILTDGATISSTELDVLDDGLDPADLDDADYGDFTLSSGVATLDADVVAAAEMADADHGDVSWSGGVATVENLQCTGCVAGAELADADLGDVSVSSGVVTLDDDVVSTAEMADADHGDFTYSAGVATLDANVVGAAEMADDAIGPAEMADGDHGDISWSGGVASIDNDVVDGEQLADTITLGASETSLAFNVSASTLTFGKQGNGLSLLKADQSGAPSSYAVPMVDIDYTHTTTGAGHSLLRVQSAAAGTDYGIDASDADLDVAIDIGANAIETDSGNVTAAELYVLSGGIDPADLDDGDYGDFTMTSGVATLDADVVAADEMADADHGDVSWSGGVASIDSGVVGRDEIDETLLSAQTHATDCTALTCDAGSDGEMCFEQDDDAWYVCDGSGTPAWAGISGGSTAFSDLTGSTNTSAAMVVGTGASLSASGSGSITATAVAADSVALSTDTTGAYVADVTGGAGLTATGGGSEGATVTVATASGEAGFLADGGVTSLTCGASNQGRMQVLDDGSIEYCDGATTSVLQAGFLDADGTDDDVPESGDFGAALDLEADGSLSVDVVAAAEMADADHGAVSWTGGVATVEDLACTGCVAAAELADADFGDWTVASGVATLDADVVAAAEMADADHGAVSWSGGVATVEDLACTGCVAGSELADADLGDVTVSSGVITIDAGVVGRSEIDETLLSIQSHATDCTALTCDAGSDGELCLEQDDDQVYACDGSGTPAWVAVGGGSTAFSALTGGTNTAAAMVVGTGASLAASGSGSITATAVAADSVALTTDTTGNYVASITNGSGITGGNGGSEGAALTLAATLGTDIAAAEMADGDHGDFTYSSGVATIDADVVDATRLADAIDIGSENSLQFYTGSSSVTVGKMGNGLEALDVEQSGIPSGYTVPLVKINYSHTTTGAGHTMLQLLSAAAGTDYAIDASDADFDVAIDIGANSIETDGATISSTELDVLDAGLDPGDMDDGDWGDFTMTSGVATLDADTVSDSELAEGLSIAWTGDHDFGGGVLQVPNSITLPATCEVGDVYMDTDATSGSRWYLCESANTWVVQGGSEVNDLEATDPPNVQDDEVYVGNGAGSGVWIALADSDGAGQKLTYDTATNSFAAGTDDDVPDDDSEVPDAITVSAGTVTNSDLTLKQSAAPAPTAEGRVEWDTDDDVLKVGDGSGTRTFSPSWPPQYVRIPAEACGNLEANFSEFVTVSDTNMVRSAQAFNDTTEEYCTVPTFRVPQDLDTSGTVTFRASVMAATAAASKNVGLTFGHSAIGDSEDFDVLETDEDSGAVSISATQDDITHVSWTETVTNLGWAAGDTIEARFSRDPSVASDLTGDLWVFDFEIEIPQAP